VAGMRTGSKKINHYVINGSKTLSTNSVYSDYLVVAAKTDPEAKGSQDFIFLMDRETAGIVLLN
jgi:alkylation response protein AidB-like acyl-CoA dehydrogenase